MQTSTDLVGQPQCICPNNNPNTGVIINLTGIANSSPYFTIRNTDIRIDRTGNFRIVALFTFSRGNTSGTVREIKFMRNNNTGNYPIGSELAKGAVAATNEATTVLAVDERVHLDVGDRITFLARQTDNIGLRINEISPGIIQITYLSS